MRKAIVTAFLVLGLLLLLSIAVRPVKAEGISVNVQQTSETTFVYQPVEITATLSGGVPPTYTSGTLSCGPLGNQGCLILFRLWGL
jgi:hypothetical protein